MEIEISDHARTAMERHWINEDEVIEAFVDGRTEFEIIVQNEKRYANVLIQKTRKIVVIWTHRNEKRRVITCYPLKRKV
jgi:hypothetical protein